MKFSCLQQDMVSSIQTVQKAAAAKGTSPIYQYLYIETLDDSIRVVATNQSQTIATVIPAQIEESGKILLPISLFRDVVSKMPSVIIEMKSNDRNLMTVSYVNMKYSIQGMPVGEYTFMDDIAGDMKFDIETEKFRKYVKQTYFTASTEETKPTLNGIFLKCRNGALDVVTSDSYRLSLVKGSIDSDITFDIIVPAKILSEILSSADDEDKITNVVFNSKYIKIQTGKTTLVTGLISGNFINYDNIIPKEYKTKMVCGRQALLSILERAFVLSDKTTLYPVKFEIGYSKLFVSSNSEAGEAYEEIQVQTDGDGLTIAFNSKYFIEILRNTEYENLQFEFTSSTRTCVIRPTDTDDVLYLILPIRM